MKKLSENISSLVHTINENNIEIKKIFRGSKVRSIWASCVEEIILDHTNAVYIFKEEEKKIMVVYVDESIFAAELNSRRELIKLKIKTEHNEDIDDFRILISRGNYKKNYPFKANEDPCSMFEKVSTPLSDAEKKQIESMSLRIENDRLQRKFKQAATQNLQVSHIKK